MIHVSAWGTNSSGRLRQGSSVHFSATGHSLWVVDDSLVRPVPGLHVMSQSRLHAGLFRERTIREASSVAGVPHALCPVDKF